MSGIVPIARSGAPCVRRTWPGGSNDVETIAHRAPGPGVGTRRTVAGVERRRVELAAARVRRRQHPASGAGATQLRARRAEGGRDARRQQRQQPREPHGPPVAERAVGGHGPLGRIVGRSEHQRRHDRGADGRRQRRDAHGADAGHAPRQLHGQDRRRPDEQADDPGRQPGQGRRPVVRQPARISGRADTVHGAAREGSIKGGRCSRRATATRWSAPRRRSCRSRGRARRRSGR